MGRYLYTFRNELDVKDVGCIEAASEKDLRKKLAELQIRPWGYYCDKEYMGHKCLFSKFTRKRYHVICDNGEILRFSGVRYWSRGVLLAAMVLTWFIWYKVHSFFELPFDIAVLVIQTFLLAGFLDLSVFYEMDVDPQKNKF